MATNDRPTKRPYPDLYAILKQHVRHEAERLKPSLTIQQEAALSVLFGEPLTPMMQPAMVRAFQATFANSAPPPDAGSRGPKPNAPARPLTKAGGGSLASGFDRFERSDGGA
jgi:hypothetical protein